MDDPLRVLRAVRFAARYAFTLADDIGVAVEDEQVREGLRTKVSTRTSRGRVSGDVERTRIRTWRCSG